MRDIQEFIGRINDCESEIRRELIVEQADRLHIFLRRLRDTNPDVQVQFWSEGQCFNLYPVVKAAFPDVSYWEIQSRMNWGSSGGVTWSMSHALIGREDTNSFYDINGKWPDWKVDRILNAEDFRLEKVDFNKAKAKAMKTWAQADNRKLSRDGEVLPRKSEKFNHLPWNQPEDYKDPYS